MCGRPGHESRPRVRGSRRGWPARSSKTAEELDVGEATREADPKLTRPTDDERSGLPVRPEQRAGDDRPDE